VGFYAVLGLLDPEAGTDRLSQKVGNTLQFFTASKPRGGQVPINWFNGFLRHLRAIHGPTTLPNYKHSSFGLKSRDQKIRE
jgi:hypothetical protein